MKNKQIIQSPDYFFCVECGKSGIPIIRPSGKQREAGHLKKLYCIYCKKETNHAEIKDKGQYTKEDFQQEFELGRFRNGERIKIQNLIKCSNSVCKYNLEGYCWNANYSYKCSHRLERSDNNE